MFRFYRSDLRTLKRVGAVLILVAFICTTFVAQGTVSAGSGIDVVNTVALKLRTAPSLLAGVIAKIPAGTPMKAIARNAPVTWVLVEVDNIRGWVATFYLLRVQQLADLPIGNGGATTDVAGSGVVAPGEAPINGITATAVVTMNVRGGPGRQYPIIGKLLTGQSVVLTGRVGFWLRFRFRDGGPGWLHISLVSLAGGSIDDLPEVSFPPA